MQTLIKALKAIHRNIGHTWSRPLAATDVDSWSRDMAARIRAQARAIKQAPWSCNLRQLNLCMVFGAGW
eukprot:3888448-Alexandrium_andersonii.AAC.1